MNKIWTFLAVIAISAFTLSCENIEPAPTFEQSSTQITLAASTDVVSNPAADSLNTAVTFTWNDPQYSVGLDRSKFTLKVAASGSDFVDFLSKDFTGVLEGSLTGKELNGMALRFGGVAGQPITLDVELVGSHLNNNEPKVSNVLSITVTPYDDLVLAASSTTVVCSAPNALEVGVSFTWNAAFNGFDGVKTYEFQYAPAGTSFASPTVINTTSYSYSYSQFELNKLALDNGVPLEGTGSVEFRIKVTNELGTVLYSNVVSVSITTYVAYTSVGLIGDATAGAWDFDTDMHRVDPINKPTEWVATLYLIGGKSVKFRNGDAWDVNWGSLDFPTGTGTQNGDNIPVSTSGYYKVDFNAGSGAYTFTPITPAVPAFVSLIGEQTAWGSDIADLTKDAGDPNVWTGTVHLTVGLLKFRADHDWATNWGISAGTAATDLSGYSEQNGGNMEITTEADYFVYINIATGEYFFGRTDRSVPYTALGIIGSGTPGDWSTDTPLIKNPSNAYMWSGTVTLIDGEAKFRADNDWAVNWGDTSFPEGVGTQNGPNIPVTAGTYFITFNTATGEYSFIQ